MSVDTPAELRALQLELIALARDWALRRTYDPEYARRRRQRALLLAHDHYRAHVPAYRRLAHQERIGALDTLAPIIERMMSTDDLFKSYRQQWLDGGDFAAMTGWIAELHHRPLQIDVAGVTTIDEWIERLEAVDVRPVYSSGTSGTFSFVPRDVASLARVRTASAGYLLPQLLYDRIGGPLERTLTRIAARLLAPVPFERLLRAISPRSYDGVFLDFRHGRTGMQAIGREAAPVFRRRCFLYDSDLSAATLRSLARGPRTARDREQLERLHTETIVNREANFNRVLDRMRDSVADGRKVFIFGVPFQLKDLCEHALRSGRDVRLRDGSMVLFGGGWKSYTGERIPRSELMQLVHDALGIPEVRVIEGYSMTEINVMMVRCVHGRFHIPPIVEPVVFDEALSPLQGDDLRGTIGFLDPLATAYPGFVISGDAVRMVDGACPCGLVGPAVTEIGRAARREVKGCGGVMASLRA